MKTLSSEARVALLVGNLKRNALFGERDCESQVQWKEKRARPALVKSESLSTLKLQDETHSRREEHTSCSPKTPTEQGISTTNLSVLERYPKAISNFFE